MKKISVIGMGYVGTAMATLIASTKKGKNKKYFVTGIEQSSKSGKAISKKINSGILPIEINDNNFKNKFFIATNKEKNLVCSNSIKDIRGSKIVIVSINCDLEKKKNSTVNLKSFLNSIEIILLNIDRDALLIVESTIPPGTCEKKIVPLISKIFRKRGFKKNETLLAYTYERVMPGDNYLNSIKNYWRVMSGVNKKSILKCKKFLKEIINTKKYPLTELKNIRDCELGKILENSYRSTNIAFIEEWSRFAEAIDVDIYKVIESIRLRPTHSNIRHPGFGVGGYCLTKDPLFGEYAAKNIWNIKKLKFPFSKQAMKVNDKMYLITYNKIKRIFKENIKNKKILILGMSYKENVGDLRSSPSIYFSNMCEKKGAKFSWHDPFVKSVPNKEITKINTVKNLSRFDLVVFTVKHNVYKKINFDKKSIKNTIIFDANYVLTDSQLAKIKKNKINFYSIGRGSL
ncbi:nucleotide sugar dehydrogenase [Candidatus Pelagibacter sp.]|nr:nucleotide sugar dehydrogenase [Candidatus Pelagibacter sp.]